MTLDPLHHEPAPERENSHPASAPYQRQQAVPPAQPSVWPQGTPGLSDPLRTPSASRKKRSVSFWVALLLLLLLGCSMLINLTLATLSSGGGTATTTDTFFSETVVEGSGDDKIALINIKGVILDQDQTSLLGSSPSIVTQTVRKLRQATKDDRVQAIVLAIDSPGGGVTASDIIYNEVKKAKAAGKKIVVHMGDLCASGGYYISAPADHIVASPTTITGSIGVILSTMDASEAFGKIGVKQIPIKSGQHKDILSISRPMEAEELEILQGVIMDMYSRFVNIVMEGRKGHAKFPLTQAEVEKIADGRIYTGTQALENGLVDSTGYQSDAIKEAKRIARLKEATVISYHREASFMDMLNGNVESRLNINAGVQIDTGNLLRHPGPRFEYRWNPGL